MSYVDAALAPQRKTGQIKLHGTAAFEGMRKAGRLAAECLDMLTDQVEPGVSTDRIDRLAFEFAMDHAATPATLMYRGYRKSTCTSVNSVRVFVSIEFAVRVIVPWNGASGYSWNCTLAAEPTWIAVA